MEAVNMVCYNALMYLQVFCMSLNYLFQLLESPNVPMIMIVLIKKFVIRAAVRMPVISKNVAIMLSVLHQVTREGACAIQDLVAHLKLNATKVSA